MACYDKYIYTYEHAILGLPTAMESELAVDSCIRGHRTYKNFWTPTMGEQLSCKRIIVVAYWRAWAFSCKFFTLVLLLLSLFRSEMALALACQLSYNNQYRDMLSTLAFARAKTPREELSSNQETTPTNMSAIALRMRSPIYMI